MLPSDNKVYVHTLTDSGTWNSLSFSGVKHGSILEQRLICSVSCSDTHIAVLFAHVYKNWQLRLPKLRHFFTDVSIIVRTITFGPANKPKDNNESDENDENDLSSLV